MRSVPRNAPCPCGSGRKHKRCCGMTREEEREARRILGALHELASLAGHFPTMRPRGRRFARWAEACARDPIGIERTIEEGSARVGRRERARIVGVQPRHVWRQLCDEAGGEEIAERAAVAGAVVAAVNERLPLDAGLLDALERDRRLRSEPVETLALALEPCDLWSILELALAEPAWTRWHDDRVQELVGRVRPQLAARPALVEPLDPVCAEVGRDSRLREQIGAIVLEAGRGAAFATAA